MPLTEQLNKLYKGCEEHTTMTKISHLLYTDNLKLTGKIEEQFQKQMENVRTFVDDTCMEFGLDECAKSALTKGKLVHYQNFIPDINTETQELEKGKTYKYLGLQESEGRPIQHQHRKESVKKEYTMRLRIILKFKFNTKNKITATGELAVPLTRYSFDIIGDKKK
jgi:hypothetical protein